MTGLEFGDVVLVPFPFTDQSASKQRPAVIVSSNRYNAERPDVIVLAVTSRGGSGRVGDRPVREWHAAGLLLPSFLKPLLATVEASIVRRRLGKLGPADLAAVRELLAEVIG